MKLSVMDMISDILVGTKCRDSLSPNQLLNWMTLVAFVTCVVVAVVVIPVSSLLGLWHPPFLDPVIMAALFGWLWRRGVKLERGRK